MSLPDATLQALLDQADRLIVVVDREARVAFANRAIADLLGWSREELDGRDFFDTCVPPDERRELRAGFQLLLAGETEATGYFRARTLARSGETPVVSWQNTLLRDDGYVTGVLATGTVCAPSAGAGRDTEAELRGRAAAARARRFQELFDVAPVGYVVVDPHRRILLSNARAAELLGYKPDHLMGRHVSTVAPGDPDQDQRAGDLLDRMYAGETVVDEEIAVTAADGRTLWLKATMHPVFDEEGEVVEGRVAVADITAQHDEAERARLYASIVDHMPVGVAVLEMADPDDPESFRFIEFNRACYEQLPREAGRAKQGDTLRVLAPRAIATGRHEIYADVVRSGERRHIGEVKHERRDGSHAWLMVEAFPLPGNRLGIAFENVTERKETELELHRRTEELARSNQDLEQFASVASHDLRAPLQVILGRIEMLEASLGELAPREQRHVDLARQTVLRMDRLIDDLLSFARIGRDEQAQKPVDTARVVAEAIEDLSGESATAGARIERDDLPAVQGHESQLGQLFRNLLSNALKFRSDDRPPHITIRAVRESNSWHFTITDDGVGFPPEQADDIFEMFHRVNREGDVAGTGIGLAVCRRIVEHHGGRIWAESEPGAGSTFHFTLRAVDPS